MDEPRLQRDHVMLCLVFSILDDGSLVLVLLVPFDLGSKQFPDNPIHS